MAGRTAARAGRRPRAHRDRRRPARRTCARRSASWPGEGLDLIAHQRRPRADRRRSHGRGRRRLPGPGDGARRGALGADRGDRRAADETLAEHRPGGGRARPTASRRRSPTGAEVLEPVGTAPGLVVAPADGDGRAAPTVVVLPGPAARAAADVGRRAGERGVRAVLARASDYRAADAAPVRDPRVGDRRDAARSPSARASSSSALEVTTCLKRGEVEVVTRYEPDARGRLRGASRRSCASATATRSSPRTAARSTRWWPALLRGDGRAGADDRDRRVLHGRAAGGAADRAAGLLRLRAWAAIVAYSNDVKVAAGRRAGRADRAPRCGLPGGGRGARRRARARASARTSASASPAWPARAAAARRSPSGSCG